MQVSDRRVVYLSTNMDVLRGKMEECQITNDEMSGQLGIDPMYILLEIEH